MIDSTTTPPAPTDPGMQLPSTPGCHVPFHRPNLGLEEEREVIDTLRSGWLTTGSKTKRFEQQFAEYLGARHAIAVNSCTAALHLSLIVNDVRPGDEVITTPITFGSTANVIEHVGAKPVFVDVQPDTLNIDPAQLAQAISPKTRAIIVVHFAGHPCEMSAISEIASKHGIPIIEDAAHAIESVYRGKKIGTISRTTCFSFYATKNITTAEGGMIATDDDALAQRLRVLSHHGISVHAWDRYGPGEYKHWDILEAGYKYNMSDLQACLGIHQLARVEAGLTLRRKWTERYDESFAGISEIMPMERHPDVESAYHLYVLRFATERLNATRDQIMQALQERGVGVGVHFRPVHLHPYYRRKYGYQPGALPVAEGAGERVISIPLFPVMTETELQHVIDQVRSLVASLLT